MTTGLGGAYDTSSFVGRRAQLSEVEALVRRLSEGVGSIMVIEGEAGIGKSRLVQEALSMAASHGCEVLVGRAEELDRTRPFRAIATAVGAKTGSADEQRAAIARMLADATDALGVGHRVHEACLSLIEQTALRSPTMLVLDDLHWADPSTVAVIRSAARQTGDLPLAVVVALRPLPRSAELAAALDDLAALGGAAVTVPPFDREDARLLVGDTAAAWNDRAGGNPFFLMELARSLPGEVGDEGELPPGVKEVVLRRARQLPGPVVELLRVASVLGSGFALTDLALVMHRSVIELLPLVSDALAAGLLVEDSGGLRFRHELVREALYSDLPRTGAAALHLEVGWALAAAGADAVRVAPHLVAGAQPGDVEAIAWLRRAAEHTARRSLPVGVELLDAAAGLASPRPEEAAQLSAEAIPLLTWAGRLDEAIARATRVLEAMPSLGLELAVRRDLAEALALAGREMEVAATVDAALRLPGIAPGVEAELRALASVAERNPVRAASALQTAKGLAEQSGDPGPLSVVGVMAAYRASDELRLTDALTEADAAVAAARAAVDAGGGRAAARLLFALQVQSYMLYMVDRSPEAIVASEEARRLAALLGAETVVADISLTLGSFAEELGQWDRAVTEIETYEQLTGNETMAAVTRYNMTATLGNLEEADRLWRLLAGAYPDDGMPHAILLMRGRHLVAAGRRDEALLHLRAVWERSRAQGARWRTRAGSVALVRLALDAGDSELAEAVAAESIAHATHDPGVHSLVGTGQLVRAMIDGDVDAALAAAEELRLSGLPLTLGDGLIEAARVAQAAGRRDVALAAASEAHELLDGIGAAPAAGVARALLKELGRPRPRGQSRPRRPTSGWESLSPTEAAVVEAIAEGLSNPQIAARLYMSRYTVESHVKHIFVKLGMKSRVELAAQAVRRDLTAAP